MAWVETTSLSFAARHDSDEADDAVRVLEELEHTREDLAGLFATTPGEVDVILHPQPLMLGLAQPWLPLARMAAAPASRRYLAGWFTTGAIHVLAPSALERRASGSPGSREALMLAPQHEYTHLVLGANNPDLPPRFTPATFRRYLRWAWLCEGAATWFAGQTPHLRPAIVRRLREEGRPDFPPTARDAPLLGGTLFSLLDEDRGVEATVALAETRLSTTERQAIEDAFGRPAASVERDWRELLDDLRAG